MRKREKTARFVTHEAVLAANLKDADFKAAFEKRKFIQQVAVAVHTMRQEAGITQAQLAKMIGASQPLIARLERGHDQRRPRFDLLEKIGSALGKQLRLVFAKPSKRKQYVEVEGVDLSS